MVTCMSDKREGTRQTMPSTHPTLSGTTVPSFLFNLNRLSDHDESHCVCGLWEASASVQHGSVR